MIESFKGADFLFVSYGGGHVAALAPVAQEMLHRGYEVAYLALTTAGPVVERLGIPTFSYRHLPLAATPEIQSAGIRLAQCHDANSLVPHDETIAYLGMNHTELVQTLGEGAARTEYNKRGRQAFYPVETMKKVLDAVRPRVVVTTNSPRSERAMIAAAQACAVPSLCLVDLFALQEFEWLKDPSFGNRICVLNESVRDRLVQHGRPYSDIAVTGNPAFDSLYEPEVIAAGAKRRKDCGWNDGKINILYASSVEPSRHPFTGQVGNPDLPQEIEAKLRDIVERMSELRLIVRYHPSQTCEFHPAERVEQSRAEEDVTALLHAVDVVVVASSTVGLQAHLIGRKVLNVECSVFTAGAPYSEMNIASAAKSVDDIESVLMTMIKETSTPRQRRGMINKATLAVVDELLNLHEMGNA